MQRGNDGNGEHQHHQDAPHSAQVAPPTLWQRTKQWTETAKCGAIGVCTAARFRAFTAREPDRARALVQRAVEHGPR